MFSIYIEIVKGQVVAIHKVERNYKSKSAPVEPVGRFKDSRIRLITEHQFEVLEEHKFKVDDISFDTRKADDEASLMYEMIKLDAEI